MLHPVPQCAEKPSIRRHDQVRPGGQQQNKGNEVKRAVRLISAIIIVLALVGSSSAAFAEERWIGAAKKLFENDEYEKCIEMAEPHRKQNIAAMLLAFSHLQENIFNQRNYDKEKFKSYQMQLEAKTSVDDVKDFLYFVNQTDKPAVVKEARSLARDAFKSVTQVEVIPKLVYFLGTDDVDSQALALAAIKRIIVPKRSYVSKGGTLRPKDIKIMQSKKLILPLLERVEMRDAQKTLLEIEEPVLQFTASFEGKEIAKLETQINKAVAKREKRFPESNWYSAVGKNHQ